MTNPKPKSVRLAILSALARNGITTLDDLQTQTGEARKKLQDHTMHAINLKLITRTQDDVTHHRGPAGGADPPVGEVVRGLRVQPGEELLEQQVVHDSPRSRA